MFNMSHEQHNPNDRFAAWGKAQQQMPSRNLELKNVALFSLKPVEKKFKFRPFRWLGYSLGSVIAAYYFVVLPVIAIKLKIDEKSESQAALTQVSYAPTYATVENTAKSSDTFGLNPLNSELQGTLGNSDVRTTFERLTFIPPLGKAVADQIWGEREGYERGYDDVSDTREFLKTYYQATIRTRQVAKLATHIQTMARGYGGRVDDISVNKESAYITFVVPKTKFEDFTQELRGLVSPKFIEEIISAQNLLPEKQRIEKQTDSAIRAVDEVQAEREQLIKNHNTAVIELQNKINSFNPRIAYARQQYAAATSTDIKLELGKDVSYWVTQQMYAKKQLTEENAQYEDAIRLNDSDLLASQEKLGGWYQADEDLLANVETVEASVSLRWISVWELIDLYVPIGWIVGGLLLAAWIGYFKLIRRKKLSLPI